MAIAAACCALTACVSPSTASLPGQGVSPLARSGGRVLYAELAEGDIFSGYKGTQKKSFCSNPYGSRGTLVNSIGTDADGNLWVPISPSQGGGYIYSFAPNCGAQGATLSAPANAQPIGVAFGPDGTKYGLMVYDLDSTSVAVYPTGASSPSYELTDPRLNGAKSGGYSGDGIGVDAAGHVYVACCGGFISAELPHFVIKFNGHGSQTRGRKIPLRKMTRPGGSVTFDQSGNMIIPDVFAESLRIYTPPYGGDPITYPLKGSPYQCALSPGQDVIACSNTQTYTVDIYAYPLVSYLYSLKSPSVSKIPVLGVAFSN